MVDTCALVDIRTSQAMDRSRRHHTLQFRILVSSVLTRCIVEDPRKWCPFFRLVAELPGY